MNNDFYFLSKSGDTIKIINNLYDLHDMLMERIPNGESRMFIFDNDARSLLEQDLLKLCEIIENNDNRVNLENYVCSSTVLISCMKTSDIKGLVMERQDNDILIRAIMCADIEDEYTLYLNILCGVGGASLLLDAIKQMIGTSTYFTELQDVDMIYFQTVANPNTLEFYNKKDFRPTKKFVKYLEERLSRVSKEKLREMYKDKEMFYQYFNIHPELFWYKNPSLAENENLYENTNIDKIIKKFL